MRNKLYEGVFNPGVLCNLWKFSEELARWNKKFSFTTVHDDQIFEKLAAPSAWLGVEYSKEKIGLVADFGCGPGIPGVPMAIADVNNRYLLLDSNSKKIRFVQHCGAVMGLFDAKRVEARSLRLTRHTPVEPVDRLVTRAAGSMLEVVELWQGKIKPGGAADFFKGTDAGEETEELIHALPEAKVERVKTPAWFGNLVIIRVTGVF